MSSTTSAGGTTHPGSLIIAGSGISSVAHITLETVSHLKKADKVFYLVGDPVTQAFIQENNHNTTDLSVYYDTSKLRYQTYVEMAEVIFISVPICRILISSGIGYFEGSQSWSQRFRYLLRPPWRLYGSRTQGAHVGTPGRIRS